MYVDAPDAVMFTLLPAQMLAEAGENVSVGTGFTTTESAKVFPVHPSEVVPVTEYVVVTVGHTTKEPPVIV